MDFKITKKEFINHNVFILEVEAVGFILPSYRLSCYAKIYKDDTSKSYTPIRITSTKLTFLIKKYEEGNISKYLEKKDVNDTVRLTFPHNKGEYLSNEHKNVLMIAGGTGITPMIQLLDQQQNFTILFFNKSEEDIFYEKELRSKANLICFVESGTENVGIPSVNTISPFISNKDFVYVCGPPGMLECVSGKKEKDGSQGELKGILKELGLTKEMVYKF